MKTILKSWKQDLYELQLNMRFQHLRNRKQGKLAIVLLGSGAMALLFYLIPLVGKGFPEDASSFLSTNLTFMNVFLIFNSMYLGADAINREHATKTALFIFFLPQRRSIVIIAKYLTQA